MIYKTNKKYLNCKKYLLQTLNKWIYNTARYLDLNPSHLTQVEDKHELSVHYRAINRQDQKQEQFKKYLNNKVLKDCWSRHILGVTVIDHKDFVHSPGQTTEHNMQC